MAIPGATGDRCADLDPSNGLGMYLDMAATAPDTDLADGATINTDTGVIVSGGQAVILPNFAAVQPGTSVEIRVVVTKRLVLRNTTVQGQRALAFVADDAIQLNGELDAAANHASGVAGSLQSKPLCTAGDGRSTGTDGIGVGGGGGGNATRGAAGGGNSVEPAGGIGGAIVASALEPLIGGCGGGNVPATAGTGGGAIQLVSRTSIAVAVAGTSIGKIHVGGGGGHSGGIDGGPGGGAGGGVLLEAPVVVLAGAGAIIAANGGGGGNCGDGQNATASTSTAAGADACATIGAGGNGAAGSTAAGIGASAQSAGGGGGGGLGYLVVHDTAGQFAPQDGAAVSATLQRLPLRRRARK